MGFERRASPVLSPNRWTRYSRRPAQYGFADGIDATEPSWLASRRRFADDARYAAEPPFARCARNPDAIHGSTPEMRALRSRIMDSPSHVAAADVPPYLRSVENRRLTQTPRRNASLGLGRASPRRHVDYLHEDLGLHYKSPLLSGRSRLARRRRESLPELRIGAYTPRSYDRLSALPSYRTERRYDAAEEYRPSPIKNRINIHATDDILNRIKRSLSECESITKRLDRQYGGRRSHAAATTDYSERVFPRALADNLFSSNGTVAPSYRNRVRINRANIAHTAEDTQQRFRSVEEDEGAEEKPKSTLARILENIKRIRNRALFSDADEDASKRKFVEVEKEELESPRISTRRNRALDVDAIQQRIKMQKRSLLSQRTLRHLD